MLPKGVVNEMTLKEIMKDCLKNDVNLLTKVPQQISDRLQDADDMWDCDYGSDLAQTIIFDGDISSRWLEAKSVTDNNRRMEIIEDIKNKLVGKTSSIDPIVDVYMYALDIEVSGEQELVAGQKSTAVFAAVKTEKATFRKPDVSVDTITTEAILDEFIKEPINLTWECLCHYKKNKGKFCVMCGIDKVVATRCIDKLWICSCGKENFDNYCTSCQKKKK